MRDLQWEGNSRKMYEAILREIPPLFSGGVRRSIDKWIVRNNIQVVTEDIVFKAVDEIAPPALARKRIKPELEKLRSK